MKKFITSFLSILIIAIILSINLSATPSLVPLMKADGSGSVRYRDQNIEVLIPNAYTQQETDFRAVWVSPLVSDIGTFTNAEVYKNELLGVLDVMETYKLNAIVFHVRIMNDALYDSDLNPKSNYIRGANFEEWDYLEWFIDEVHRRGIEFHAWLNPYRITNYETTLSSVLSRYSDYPNNPASKAENVLIGDKGAILNPGEPAVRDFVVDTCMEIIERYDVDAIHFDDYFYASMPSTADDATYNKYKANSTTTNKYDWRREQIDLFIEDLSQTIRSYNTLHNRNVQLGIAPTGIWRNGNGQVTYDSNGTAITSGSATAGQEHYASYLYCNTKKWVDEEWIDYIVPQSYWSFELYAAPYAAVVDWWAKVVKYKDVNLYTGMGLYRKYTGDSGGSWERNDYEASNQILYNTKHKEIQGVVIFNFKYLRTALSNPGVNKILTEYWTNPALTPTIRTMNKVVPNKVENVKIAKDASSFVLYFDEQSDARKYAIYKNENNVDVNDPTQLLGVVGANKDGKVIFVDETNTNINYNYSIVAVSGTNTKSTQTVVNTSSATDEIDLTIGEIENLNVSGTVFPGKNVQISFRIATVYFGSDLQYDLRYSYDGINWIIVPESEFRRSGNSYSYQLPFAIDKGLVLVKVVGTNSFGQIETLTEKVTFDMVTIIDYFYTIDYIWDNKISNFFNFE